MAHSFRLSMGALGVAAIALGPVKAIAAVAFLPHQALYELSLLKTRGSSPINSARGRMVYQFSGNPCEGYTSESRQVSELDVGEGKVTLSDLRMTAWEDAAGNSYHFKSDSRMNETGSSPTDGVAERNGDHITVKLKQPVVKTFTLDGATVFPNQQVQRIIEAARDGKTLLELTFYDGSDDGEKVYNTLTVIGQPIAPDKPVAAPDPAIQSKQLKGLTRWPVTVSYYDRDPKKTEATQTPVYTMSFELYENGVSRSLVLDYNDFVIAGALSKLEVKDSKDTKSCSH